MVSPALLPISALVPPRVFTSVFPSAVPPASSSPPSLPTPYVPAPTPADLEPGHRAQGRGPGAEPRSRCGEGTECSEDVAHFDAGDGEPSLLTPLAREQTEARQDLERRGACEPRDKKRGGLGGAGRQAPGGWGRLEGLQSPSRGTQRGGQSGSGCV